MFRILLLAFLCSAVPVVAQKNTFRFTERISFNVPLNTGGETKLGGGPGFDASVSYQFSKHWQTSFEGAWHHFPATSSVAETRLASLSMGSLYLGLRHERKLKGELRWFLAGAVSVAKSELFDNNGMMYENSTAAYGYDTECGFSTLLLEGLEVGAFVRLTDYLQNLSEDQVPVADHAGLGLSLRWWWW